MPAALLTLPAAALRLAISRRTLEREIATGRLAVVRIRGAVRVAESDLEAYIVRLRKYQEPEAPCPPANVVTFGTSASRSRGSALSAVLDEVLPGRMRSRSKHRSAATTSTAS
jgi:excisionase family DNA binding protein